MPKNWKDFLRVEKNKTELFTFLSQQAINTPIEISKSLYATDGPNLLCSAVTDLFRIDPCSHEEADTRLYLHVADAFRSGNVIDVSLGSEPLSKMPPRLKIVSMVWTNTPENFLLFSKSAQFLPYL